MIARKPYVKINIDKYPTTFFYEKMKISPDDFTNDTTNDFFKKIVAEKNGATINPIKPKEISDRINGLLSKICNEPNIDKPKKKTNFIGVDCINIIGNHILQYNINKLWYTNTNTIFLFPIISTSSDRGEKLLLKQIPLYQQILQKEGFFNQDKCIEVPSNKPVETTYNQKGLGNTLEYLNIISEDDEDIETFKLRLKNNLDEIKQRIEAREDADNKNKIGSCKQYNKIIFFVNKINGEEDPMFIKYYKKGLKKEFINALKEQLNKFFNTNPIGRQPVTYNNSLPDTNNIEKLTKDSIISKLKNSDYGYEQSEISEHIDNIQLLLEKFKMFYKRETDENYRKSITSSDNSDIFNIFMRFNNLDIPVITDDIIANRDTLYLFKEKDKKARIGFFYVSNLEKHQYIFNLDLIENKKYKDLQKNQLLKKDDKKNSTKDEDEEDDDREAAEIEESLIINPLLEIKDSTRKTLVEVKLEFGKLIFRNIQKDIKNNYDSLNEINYYGQRKSYDYYRWFNHRMIDTSLTDNINIRFFKDTIYDVKSFKAYLDSEKKLLKDTRVPLEFLKINASPEILKYNDYIFNNFKGNINPRLYLTDKDNYSFEEKIKKGIVDILFERNSLVYIKDIKQVSEKEKEAATPQNYKIIKYKYVPIFGKETNKLEIIYKHFKEKVTTSVNEIEINYYKNWSTLKSYNEERQKAIINEKQNEEKTVNPLPANPLIVNPLPTNNKTKATFNSEDNIIPTELLTQMVNKKKTLGILIVDVSKDVFSNPVSLYLAAECKTRSKRLKDTYYNIKKYFRGGTNKKKRIKITRRNRNRNNYKSRRKSIYKPIHRRI
jgi:hypothetical protein